MSRHEQPSQRGRHGERREPHSVPDFQQLIEAREELAKLEAKLQVPRHFLNARQKFARLAQQNE